MQAFAEVEQATFGGNLGLGVVGTQTRGLRSMESRQTAHQTRVEPPTEQPLNNEDESRNCNSFIKDICFLLSSECNGKSEI